MEVHCSLRTVEAISKVVIIIFYHCACSVEERILGVRHKLGDIFDILPNGLADLFKRVHVFVKENSILLKNQHGSRHTAARDTRRSRHVEVDEY